MRIFIFLCFFLAGAALANPSAQDCLFEELLRINRSSVNDTSIELEMAMTPEVFKMLTTVDGKVGPALGQNHSPPWLIELKNQKFPNLSNSKEILWDDLSDHQKLEILKITSARKADYNLYDYHRSIPGIKIRDIVELDFKSDTVFMGKAYTAGKHKVDVSQVLAGAVEYRSAGDVREVTGVELHYRDSLRAGDVSFDARQFQLALGLEGTHQHAHVVSSLPLERLKADPLTVTAQITDFNRRANGAAEMSYIVEQKGSLSEKAKDDRQIFGTLKSTDLGVISQYLLQRSKGVYSQLKDKLKIAFVAFRGSDSYDQPDLIGSEFRALTRKGDPKRLSTILNGVQSSQNRSDYGLTSELGYSNTHTQNWLKHLGVSDGSQLGPALEKTWYNQNIDYLFEHAPPEIALHSTPYRRYMKLLLFGEDPTSHSETELKMLLFDWSNDSLVYHRPDFAKKIRAEQIRAWEKMQDDQAGTLQEIVSDFLIRSGLYQEFLKSVGTEPLKSKD